jgi:ABC-type amino acid transport system permease subunit
MAEVFRAGLQTIPAGQHRAAKVLGLSAFDRFLYVIFPQTFRVILAPSTNVLVTLIKDTSLASVIGVAELMHRGEVTAASNFRYLEILTFVGLVYVAINYPLILISKRLETARKRGFVSA